ncbi:venom serine carboxypeptidase-like, partial [Vespula maculifrons]
DVRRDQPWHDFPTFVVLTKALLVRSIRSSEHLSGRVLSGQRTSLTTLASCNISRNLIYIDNPVGTGYFTRNDKDYASNEIQVARYS